MLALSQALEAIKILWHYRQNNTNKLLKSDGTTFTWHTFKVPYLYCD
ncbi:hypothetical protein C427_2128 [Paraglaciecola psychrophila 170]|uniref:Uncharacterized protein n=1 Tax=Paraglaciecola psychrophila 170 TaxID=1129794 RepID=K6ZWU5_9ALTE|nr:hypothetical protein C427_2128 [Paraglaciecola psychrophila 170]GAC40371.1 hypothetical protein GPSY_4769 [Paraglaciecola psychrophila 170]